MSYSHFVVMIREIKKFSHMEVHVCYLGPRIFYVESSNAEVGTLYSVLLLLFIRAPDAPPVGLLCYPSVLDVPTFAASPASRPCYPRDP
jgi:hypothetical protein